MIKREILLSIQRALIGHVTHNLRSVCIENISDVITLVFYYDQSPSEEEVELASLVDTEFISDFPTPEYKTDSKVLTLPYPEPIPDNGECVYLRYEQ